MDNNYGGVIWTNHVLDRLNDRGIKQGDAWATWRNPDKSRFSKAKNAWIYEKNFGRKTVDVVAKHNENGEWVIISVWSKLVTPKKSYSIFSFFKKVLLSKKSVNQILL